MTILFSPSPLPLTLPSAILTRPADNNTLISQTTQHEPPRRVRLAGVGGRAVVDVRVRRVVEVGQGTFPLSFSVRLLCGGWVHPGSAHALQCLRRHRAWHRAGWNEARRATQSSFLPPMSRAGLRECDPRHCSLVRALEWLGLAGPSRDGFQRAPPSAG
jgi:hypothetical protein